MLIERLRPDLPKTSFIVLTASEKGDSLLAAVSAGAKGYLTKRATPQELVSAVLTVHGGGSVIAPSLAGHLLDAYARAANGESEQPRPKLTGAEQEVLRLLTQGLTDRQIAERL
jgi:DNA-binding NarL/FixJ family response regulator